MLAFTSSNLLMSIPDPKGPVEEQPSARWLRVLRLINPFGARQAVPGTVSFANNLFIMALGWAIFIVVVIADVYALVQLGLGQA